MVTIRLENLEKSGNDIGRGKVREIVVCLWYGIAVAIVITRNTSDCDQSNYTSRIVFSHMPIEFGQKIAPFDPPIPKTPL